MGRGGEGRPAAVHGLRIQINGRVEVSICFVRLPALPSAPTSQIVNDRPIQNAAYRPAGYTQPSTVAPVQVQPQMMAAPSYWGN